MSNGETKLDSLKKVEGAIQTLDQHLPAVEKWIQGYAANYEKGNVTQEDFETFQKVCQQFNNLTKKRVQLEDMFGRIVTEIIRGKK